MNQLQVFDFNGSQIRTVEVDNKLWFVGVDVARVLMYANPSKAIIDHCKGVSKLGIPSEGGTQDTNIIPEGDMYRLIVKAADQSVNPEIRRKAEAFERWIYDEVLPSIRKTGSYVPEKPKSQAELMLMYAKYFVDIEQRQNELEQRVESITQGLTAVPDHTVVVNRINEYARWSRLGHNEVYNKIYDVMQARFGINVRARVENERKRIDGEYYEKKGKHYSQSTLKGKVNGIDVMVRMGVLDKFNEILVGMLANIKKTS